MIYLIALFGFFFAAFRELSEHAKENGFKGYPSWWNTATSHRNKHEWGDKYLPSWIPSKIRHWVFNSLLVWTTDAEHFFQLLSMISAFFAVYFSLGGWEYSLAFYGGNVIAGGLKRFTKIR